MLTAEALAALGATWPCCPHCAEDTVHDLPKDTHDLPCTSCIREHLVDEEVQRIRIEAVKEVKEEMEARLDTYAQRGRHTRARWATEWLGYRIEKMKRGEC